MELLVRHFPRFRGPSVVVDGCDDFLLVQSHLSGKDARPNACVLAELPPSLTTTASPTAILAFAASLTSATGPDCAKACLLGHPVAEVLLFRVGAHVGKGQNRFRKTLGQLGRIADELVVW